MVLRVRQGPNDEQLAGLNERFGHLCATGVIERTDASRVERRDDDRVGLDRVALDFTKHGYGDVIAMIAEINSWV